MLAFVRSSIFLLFSNDAYRDSFIHSISRRGCKTVPLLSNLNSRTTIRHANISGDGCSRKFLDAMKSRNAFPGHFAGASVCQRAGSQPRKRRNDAADTACARESNLKSVRPLIDAPFAILMPITRQQASREIRVNPRGVLTLIKARSSLEEFKTPPPTSASSCENVLNSVERRPAPRSLSRIIINASFGEFACTFFLLRLSHKEQIVNYRVGN